MNAAPSIFYAALCIGGFILVGAMFAYYMSKSDDNNSDEL